jgi:PKD repeat protein
MSLSRYLLALFVVFLSVSRVQAQLLVTEATTNADVISLVESVFVGNCVEVSNVVFTGFADNATLRGAAGSFANGNTTNLGLVDGILITSGMASLAVGPDNSNSASYNNPALGDADLTVIAGVPTFDAAVLEFDFVPVDATLQFRYVFGSDEYPEFVNAGFNDVFGFFISGPGFAGPYIGGAENIALIPSTAIPVSIDNVNNGYSAVEPASGPCTNCGFYVDNSSGTTIQYDGFTTVLTATATLVPCQTYHIKLVVADVGDAAVESGVFLEARSFSSGNAVDVDVVAIANGTEGCAQDMFTFNRLDAGTLLEDLVVEYTVTGTANSGSDFTAIPLNITIPAGAMSVDLSVEALLDYTIEGNQSVIITVTNAECGCGAPTPPTATAVIQDNDTPLSVVTSGGITACLGSESLLNAVVSGSIGPYSISWDNGGGNSAGVIVSPESTTTYTATVTDGCGTQSVTSAEIVTVILADYDVNEIEQCFDGNQFNFTNQGATGAGVTHFWDFDDGNTSGLENPTHAYLTDGNYMVTHTVTWIASGCESDLLVEVFVREMPDATAIVIEDVNCLTLGEVTATVSGGLAPYTYSWNPGGASTATVSGLGADTYTVTVTDDNGCIEQSSATIVDLGGGAPTAFCRDVTVQLDLNGNGFLTAAQVNDESEDPCGIASITLNQNFFDCSHLGANVVTLTVTNVGGVTATCTADVTVEDNIDPIAVCQNITVQLDVTGNASITAAQINNGSSDNCAIQTITVSPSTFTCANVGANTVTLTVSDVSGNTATCTATVTVQETVAPIAVCQNITVQLDATGNASITAAQINNGSSDNCAIQTITVSPNTFTCANVGANTVTLTVTDASGNSSTCTATVTVQETVNPIAVCQNITVQLDATGNASIIAAQINNGSSDNCAIQTITVSPSTFTCANVGANTVTLTVTDASGNSSTCTATVTVQETVAPIAVCQNITVQLDVTGNASITAAQINNGSSDNCAIQTITVSPSTFTCANVGANTVTLTVSDVSGNTATCTATVTVQETVAPIAVCQNITVQLDATGNASITAAQINNGSSDNCAIQTITVSPNTFTCANVGANTVTLTVTDASGNSSTCTATVTVQETVNPIAVCQNITVQLDATGNASITAAQINNGSSDNCAIQTITVSPSAFTCANVGANTVTLTVSDVSGNTATCTATVTVQETVAPIAVCQNITVQLDVTGNASITAAQINNGSSDNCAIQTITVSPSTFTCANVGANTVTLTVSDVSGNTATCTATVTVQETVAPIAVCQNITVQLDATGNASITAAQINNGSSDNCAIQTITVSPNTFTCANVGANTVTLTVTDASGNSSTCTATVTVQETVNPIAVCQNITVQLDATGNASIIAAQINNGSSDNCAIQTITVSPSTFTCANVGANTVTLTVTDASGNSSTCTATVTVQETVAPIAVCQNITVQLDVTGNASITAAQINNGSSDNCAIQTITVSPSTFTCANVGANTVTLTVSDVSGNTATCTATVTVQETVAPIAVCQNITVQLDATGNASITAAQINNGSSDNCAIQTITVSPSTFTCANVGANTVTLTVTDASGNSSTCTATVTVQETIAPIAVCQNITVQLDATGNASITAAQINNGSSDNCAIASVTIAPVLFDCTNLGPNPVTLTVTDVNGNVNSCISTVTVEGASGLVAVCQNITIQLDATGNATINAAQVDNGSSAACGAITLAVNPSTFNCSNIGANSVTLTATDALGNFQTCAATVTVQDNISPTAICQNITVQLDANGNATVVPADIDNGSNDNCAVTAFSLNQTAFDCSNLGVIAVVLTVQDESGNSNQCNASVTVVDGISPVIVGCPVDIVIGPDPINCSPQVFWVTPTATDNCSATMASSHNSGDVFPAGSTTVTYTATDPSGNSVSCSFEVTVSAEALTAVVNPITLLCGNNVSCNGGSDGAAEVLISGGCAPYSILWSDGTTNQDVAGLSAGLVSVTVTDDSGFSVVANATLIEPTPLTITVDSLSQFVGGLNISCKGEADGEINISVQGGADCQNYTFDWGGPNGFSSSNQDISNVLAGNYLGTATDAAGCESIVSVTLTEPESLTAGLLSATDVSCPGAADGTIDVVIVGGTAPYNLQWTGGLTTQNLVDLSAGLYALVVMDTNGCQTTFTHTVLEPQPIVLDGIDVTDATCYGLSNGEIAVTPIGGTLPYSYLWEDGQINSTAVGLVSGTYTLTVTDDRGCILTDSIFVGEPLVLEVLQISLSDVTCQGENDGTASVEMTGGTAPYSFTWAPTNQTGSDVVLGVGTHFFTATDANGCSLTDTVLIGEPNVLLVSVSPDTTICSGGQAVLLSSATGGSGGYFFAWDNGVGAGANQLVFPTIQTTYTVTVTDNNGCTANESVTINLLPTPTAAFVATAVDACALPAVFTLNNTSIGATSYIWYQGTDTITAFEPSLSYDSIGTYSIALVAGSEFGCSNTAVVEVVVSPLPIAGFTVNNPDGCLPVTTVFSNTSQNANSYLWNFGDGTTGTSPSPGHSYFEVGSYSVTLIVTSAGGCSDTLTIDSAVTVFPLPIAAFTVIDLGAELGDSYQFQNSSSTGNAYAWNFGDGTNSDEYSPLHEYATSGAFDVTLTVITAQGCIDTAQYDVDVEIQIGLFVPNAIAVGQGDAGVFKPTGVGIATYRALVFDKWGNQLWESTELVAGSPSEFWDGRYQGENVPQGSYVWQVEATFLNGLVWEGMAGADGKRRTTGSVTVIY